MGMFDYVIAPTEPCPHEVCGGILDGWQSKDHHRTMATLDVSWVDRYYTHCSDCMCWVEYNRNDSGQFERTVEYCISYPE